MRRFSTFLLLIVSISLVDGCGYTTKGFVYKEENLHIKPVVNKIDIATESRKYSTYTVYPVLLEKRLTNTLVNSFNVDGNLKITESPIGALVLECQIKDYQKEALNYTDSDEVREQRLRLSTLIKLHDAEGKLLKEKDIVGETSFFLTGPHRKSESSAQNDLIEDTSRRIVEAIVEEWQ